MALPAPKPRRDNPVLPDLSPVALLERWLLSLSDKEWGRIEGDSLLAKIRSGDIPDDIAELEREVRAAIEGGKP